jgi:CBS domain-containing protein
MTIDRHQALGEPARLCVRDVMTRHPVTIDETARLSEAQAVMEQRNIQHLPVMSNGQLTGILSERHLHDAQPALLTLRDSDARKRSLYLTRVSEVCTRKPVLLTSNEPILNAIVKMRSFRGSSLPVVDDGKLVGILTAGDLLTLLQRILSNRLNRTG